MLNGAKFHINEPFINTKRPAGSLRHWIGVGFIYVTDVFQFIELVDGSPSVLSCPQQTQPPSPPCFVFKSLTTLAAQNGAGLSGALFILLAPNPALASWPCDLGRRGFTILWRSQSTAPPAFLQTPQRIWGIRKDRCSHTDFQ